MKNIYISLFLMFTLQSVAISQTISLDTKNATVAFHFISEKTKGTLTGVKANLTIDPSNLSFAKVLGSVDVTTLSTKNKMRDKHLKSDDFFNVEKYPRMTFQSSDIYQEGNKYKSKGILTIKGIQKEVTFDLKNTDSTLVFSTTIYALDFDVSTKKKREKSKVYVEVTLPYNP
ncbi:MAG: YceI family protein [Crocinitomicaceae bacterium]|nr:YceI family protein [Crocinitomicaceae bacterium]